MNHYDVNSMNPINSLLNNGNYQNCSIVQQNNADLLIRNFLSEYYTAVNLSGWNMCTRLFDPTSKSMVQNQHVGNIYGLLDTFSVNFIKRANYGYLNHKWLQANNDTAMINVFGVMQFVTFNGIVSNTVIFSETFLVKLDNTSTLKCYLHILEF
jgi:hypothetical protein